MTKLGIITVCIIETILGVFIGATTVYALVKGDIYFGGAAMMAATMAIMVLLSARYVNNMMKD